MNIGIIGAGNIGGNLTQRFRELGHNVFVANSRGPESLADLAAQTGAIPVSVTDAAQRGDVVIVTIPEKNIRNLPSDLFAGVPDTVVVVDTGNYYPQQRDGRIATGFTVKEDRSARTRHSFANRMSNATESSDLTIRWDHAAS